MRAWFKYAAGLLLLFSPPEIAKAAGAAGAAGAAEPTVARVEFSGRAKVLAGEQWQLGAKERAVLLAEAEELLREPIITIVEKQHLAASGEPRDYHSIGIYWWPNPLTKGRPYIRKDGEVNPESAEYDHPRLRRFSHVVARLAIAFAETGEERFALRAREWLRKWLLDEKTRMAPHFSYAQAWPGLNSGTAYGIIEGETLAKNVPAAVLILKEAGQLPEAEWKGIRSWFEALLDWYNTSPHGRKLDREQHNISTWYDVQRMSFTLLLGDDAAAQALMREAVTKRLGMISAQGEMPAELRRTKSWNYCCYHLRALMRLAELGDVVGAGFWYASGPSGGSIWQVVEFLLPYAQGNKEWDYPQIGKWRREAILPLLKKAGAVYQEPHQSKALEPLGMGGLQQGDGSGGAAAASGSQR